MTQVKVYILYNIRVPIRVPAGLSFILKEPEWISSHFYFLLFVLQHRGDSVQQTGAAAGGGGGRRRSAAEGQLHGKGRPAQRPHGGEVGSSREHALLLPLCSWRGVQGDETTVPSDINYKHNT